MKQYSLQKFKESKRIKRKFKITLTIMIISILIILIALYLANSDFRNFIDVHILRKEISENDAIQLNIDVEELSYVNVFNNNIITINGGVLTFYSDKGKEEENLDIILSSPISDSDEKYLVLGDKGGNKIYLINDKNIKWEKEVEGKISKVSVNKKGYVSVISSGNTSESDISVFNAKGDNIFTYHLASTYAIDSDISENNKYLAIAEVDYSGVSAKSQIKILSIDDVQKDKTKAIVHTYDGEAGDIVTDLNYQDGDNALCLFDSYIINITPEKDEKLYTIDNNSTLFADINLDKGYVKIEKESEEIFKSDYRLKISDLSNNEKLYALEGNVKKLKVNSNMMGIVSGTTVEFVSKDGWLCKKYIGSKEIKDIYISKNIAAIVYKDRIDIITF